MSEVDGMDNALISIVVANYNYGRYLHEALDSVIVQCGAPRVCDDGRVRLPLGNAFVELIIVDGGSADNSLAVIEKYKDYIAWWISERDNGQSDAFNKGFKQARGMLGCWLNADDIMLPGTLKAVCEHMVKEPRLEWITGGTVYFNEDKKLVSFRIGSSIARWMHRWAGPSAIGGPSSFFKISRLWEVGGFDMNLRYTMDCDLWHKFFKAGMLIRHTHRYFWGFRLQSSSKTASAMLGSQSDAHREEEARLRKIYNESQIFVTLRVFAMRIWRVFAGSYFRDFYNRMRYRKMDIAIYLNRSCRMN